MLYLYDLTGKLVLQKNFNRAQEKLDLRGVKSGTCVLKLRTGNVDVTEWKAVKRCEHKKSITSVTKNHSL